jgi:inhibitor of KinA
MDNTRYSIYRVGDQAITFSIGDLVDLQHHQRLLAMKAWIEEHRFEGILDVFVAYNSLTLVYDLFQLSALTPSKPFDFLTSYLEKAHDASENILQATKPVVRIPVCYDKTFGLDLEDLSKESKIAIDEIIHLHQAKTYHVFMIGFLPGFAYMAEVDSRIAFSRRPSPRTQVPAGSVGIAGIQTGIYPIDSPGGWQIIGRTPIPLFNPKDDPPVFLHPGDQVQLFAITLSEYKSFTKE